MLDFVGFEASFGRVYGTMDRKANYSLYMTLFWIYKQEELFSFSALVSVWIIDKVCMSSFESVALPRHHNLKCHQAGTLGIYRNKLHPEVDPQIVRTLHMVCSEITRDMFHVIVLGCLKNFDIRPTVYHRA